MVRTADIRGIDSVRRSRRGLTLIEVLVVAILLASLCVALRWYGVWAVMGAFQCFAALLVVVCVWSRAYLRAPRFAANATVILFIAFMAASLAPSLLVHVREQARRNQATMKMRDIGRALLFDDEFRPLDER